MNRDAQLIIIAGLLVLLGFLLRLIQPTMSSKINKVPNLIRKYVAVSLIIIIFSLSLNLLNYFINTSSELRIYFLELINFYTGVSFAVMAGYVGFTEFQNNRLDKLKDEAYQLWSSGNLNRASELYKEAYKINQNDYLLVSNYSEFALIIGDNNLFDELIIKFDQIKSEDREKIIIMYLKSTKYLLMEHLGEAKDEIKRLIKYCNKRQTALNRLGWDFKELQKSDRYKDLSGESKKILDQLINYLTKKTTEDKDNLTLLVN